MPRTSAIALWHSSGLSTVLWDSARNGRAETDEISVGIDVLTFALPVVLIAWPFDNRSSLAPCLSESISIFDVDIQHTGHVSFRIVSGPCRTLVLGEVHCQVSEVGKCVRLVVVVDSESKASVVLHGPPEVSDAEYWFMTDNLNRTTRPFDLQSALAVHPIDAVITDPKIGVGPQPDKASGERLLAAGTGIDRRHLIHPEHPSFVDHPYCPVGAYDASPKTCRSGWGDLKR
jgi:hypothetical protein